MAEEKIRTGISISKDLLAECDRYDYDRQQCSIKSKIDKKLRRSKAIPHKDRATDVQQDFL